MKPEAVRARAPDRNAAVYRSAARLLASVPPKPVRRASRPSFIVSGLAVILTLAVLLLSPVRETDTRAASGDGNADGTAAGSSHRLAGLRLKIAEATAFAFAPAAARTPNPAADETASAAVVRGFPAPVPRHIPFWVREAAQPSTTDDADQPGRAQAVIVTPATTHLVFTGELRSASAPPVAIEFDRRFTPTRLGGLLEGSVRVQDHALPPRAFQVRGVLVNRTITLNESDGTPARGNGLPAGYGFVIELADDTTPGEISGRWIRGRTQGSLVFKRAVTS